LFVYIIREIDGSRILGLLSGKDAEEITVQTLKLKKVTTAVNEKYEAIPSRYGAPVVHFTRMSNKTLPSHLFVIERSHCIFSTTSREHRLQRIILRTILTFKNIDSSEHTSRITIYSVAGVYRNASSYKVQLKGEARREITTRVHLLLMIINYMDWAAAILGAIFDCAYSVLQTNMFEFQLIDEFEEIEQVCEAKCRKSLLCDCFFIKRLYDLCLAECKLEDAARLCEKQKELKRPTKNDTAVVERQPLCMK
ncbi:hypothetical protein D918_04447, partial [Trichuris suis]